MQTESWTLLRLNPANQARFCEHIADSYPEVSTYYPTFTKLTRPAKKRYPIEVVVPVYPGYVFARLILEADMIHSLTSTPVRAYFIKFGGQISTIPDSVIKELMRLEGESQLVQEVTKLNPYVPGARVTVHFPIYDIQGIIVHLVGQTRALVDTTLCRVTVPLHHLECA